MNLTKEHFVALYSDLDATKAKLTPFFIVLLTPHPYPTPHTHTIPHSNLMICQLAIAEKNVFVVTFFVHEMKNAFKFGSSIKRTRKVSVAAHELGWKERKNVVCANFFSQFFYKKKQKKTHQIK